jgi:hypothetical protein
MFTITAITEREYKKAVKYTHPSTGMTYIKVNGNYYFARENINFRGLIRTSYIKSGALGGFQLLK